MEPSPDISTRHQILYHSRSEFLTYGFTKVTVDEICAALGMSKKTMYQHFQSKEELVSEVVELTFGEFRSGLDNILADNSKPFTDKLHGLLSFLAANITNMISQPFLNDVNKKLPHIGRRIEQFRQDMIYTRFDALIEEGIKQGWIRSNINKQLFVMMWLNSIQSIAKPDVLAHLPLTLNEVIDSVFNTFFLGVLTAEAKTNFQETSSWA
jgi:AcrR family transcriptional regulator